MKAALDINIINYIRLKDRAANVFTGTVEKF